MAKILLVEDDNNLREIYEARLLAEGYEIVAAKDGEEALALAVKEHPDLIISDVMMPKISGFDMLDILRSTPGVQHIPVVMMTALGQAEDKARADRLGADRYLVKSQVTLEDVAKVARDVLEGNSAAEPQDMASVLQDASPDVSTTYTQQSSATYEPIQEASQAPIDLAATTVPENTSPEQPAIYVDQAIQESNQAIDTQRAEPMAETVIETATQPDSLQQAAGDIDASQPSQATATQDTAPDLNPVTINATQQAEITTSPLPQQDITQAPIGPTDDLSPAAPVDGQNTNAYDNALITSDNNGIADVAAAPELSPPSQPIEVQSDAEQATTQNIVSPDVTGAIPVDTPSGPEINTASVPDNGLSPNLSEAAQTAAESTAKEEQDLSDKINTILAAEISIEPQQDMSTQEQPQDSSSSSTATQAVSAEAPGTTATPSESPDNTSIPVLNQSDSSTTPTKIEVNGAAGKKVISPLNDINSGPNIDELLAKEQLTPAAPATPANAIITPAGETSIQPMGATPNPVGVNQPTDLNGSIPLAQPPENQPLPSTTIKPNDIAL